MTILDFLVNNKYMVNKKEMNETALNLFEEITTKEVEDLTAYEIGFLKARSSYLTVEQKAFYERALNGQFLGRDFVEKKKK